MKNDIIDQWVLLSYGNFPSNELLILKIWERGKNSYLIIASYNKHCKKWFNIYNEEIDLDYTCTYFKFKDMVK